MIDIPTGLMLTFVALSEEAETPLGHAAIFDGSDTAQATAQREQMTSTIADAIRTLEHSEQFNEGPTKEQIYMGLQRLIQQKEVSDGTDVAVEG